MVVEEEQKTKFLFDIGDGVWQLNGDEDFEPTIVTDRKVIKGENYYTTEAYNKWTHESFLI
jgi:hypothetical protein